MNIDANHRSDKQPGRREAIGTGLATFAAIVAGGCRRDHPDQESGDQAESNPNLDQKLLLVGATVAGNAEPAISDIRVSDGTIIEIGNGLARGPDETVFDCNGKYILPGGIDPHVHLSKPWCDDFQSGSKAALAGGITTLGHMSFPSRGQTVYEAYNADARQVSRSGIADFFFHYVFTDPTLMDDGALNTLAEIKQPGMKLFMLTSPFSSCTDLVDRLRNAKNKGLIAVFHAEDFATLEAVARQMTEAGNDSLDHYAASRPVAAEVKAVEHAIRLCNESGCPIYLVHISSRAAIDLVNAAQDAGTPVFVETRPMYLHLTDEIYAQENARLYTGMPPVRTKDDQLALWAGINNGTIQTVASDHAPWTRKQKMDPAQTINNPRGGVNNLQYMLPMLMHEVVVNERLTLETFVDITARNAAKLFGLYPRKGEICVGADADLVVWNLNETKTITNEGHSNAGFSIYCGTEVTGWPELTFRRGATVFDRDRILDEDQFPITSGGVVLDRNKSMAIALDH